MTQTFCNQVDDCSRLVCVPGQKFWHTHVCTTCGSSWNHIAPTPMTQAQNRHIHTCTKCGTLQYEFVQQERLRVSSCRAQPPWIAIGLGLGLVTWALKNRR